PDADRATRDLMPRTPITNLVVGWCEATGHDDLLLAEGRADLATAVRVVQGRAIWPARQDGAPWGASGLPGGDVGAPILALRTERLGDRMIAEGTCGSCGAMIDVEFSITAYLEHNRPKKSGLAERAEQPGWWRLRRWPTTFRLPTAGDVLAAAQADGGRQA